MHELATTIGNTWLACGLSALAAGLAFLALLCGVARLKKTELSRSFPGDPEACVEKYALAFQQMEQVEKEKGGSISELARQLKNQPAAHLCLVAFDQANGNIHHLADAATEGKNAGADTFDDDDDDFPATVDLSIPQSVTEVQTKKGHGKK